MKLFYQNFGFKTTLKFKGSKTVVYEKRDGAC